MSLLTTVAAGLAPRCAAPDCPIRFGSPRLWWPQLRARALNLLGGRPICPTGRHRARYGVVCVLHLGCPTSPSGQKRLASLREHPELLVIDATAPSYDAYTCDAPRGVVEVEPLAEEPV